VSCLSHIRFASSSLPIDTAPVHPPTNMEGTYCDCATCKILQDHPVPPTPPPSPMSQPSQIRWSRFSNRTPSSVSELWPPSAFQRGSSGAESRVVSGSEWATTILEDWEGSTVVSQTTPPHHAARTTCTADKHESQTTKSLRRFVEREIGLDAIHSGQSEVELVPATVLSHADWESEEFFGSVRHRPGEVHRRASGVESSQGELSRTRKSKGKRSLCSKIRRLFHVEGAKEWDWKVERMEMMVRDMEFAVRRVCAKFVKKC